MPSGAVTPKRAVRVKAAVVAVLALSIGLAGCGSEPPAAPPRGASQAAQPSEFGQALNEVVEKTQLLVREEIELAKAEVSEKVNKLIKGVIVGATAGIFFVVGLLFLLHSAAWAAWQYLPLGNNQTFWIGFLFVAIVLFLLGGLAGFLAYRFVKKGSPPTPTMAIEEGKRIKSTYSAGKH